jgi:hypothetical protein
VVAVADWVTISSLATAGGTLVLAAATFSSVRSANRAARTAERALLVGLRPLLFQARLDDPVQKIHWADSHLTKIAGSEAGVELTDEVIYLSLPLRNAGSGLAVLHGWFVQLSPRGVQGHHAPDEFRLQSRDLYVSPSDVGFWQGALRDRTDPTFDTVEDVVRRREVFAIDLLYSDHEGGQRTISRFALTPRVNDDGWMCAVVRHWNLDRPDPR